MRVMADGQRPAMTHKNLFRTMLQVFSALWALCFLARAVMMRIGSLAGSWFGSPTYYVTLLAFEGLILFGILVFLWSRSLEKKSSRLLMLLSSVVMVITGLWGTYSNLAVVRIHLALNYKLSLLPFLPLTAIFWLAPVLMGVWPLLLSIGSLVQTKTHRKMAIILLAIALINAVLLLNTAFYNIGANLLGPISTFLPALYVACFALFLHSERSR